MTSQTSSSRAVNDLLHTLRGEQFRHLQNTRRSRVHIPSTFTHNSPTLPVDLTGVELSNQDKGFQSKTKTLNQRASNTNCPGPGPPKSWTLISKDTLLKTARSWRANALSLIFSHLQPPWKYNPHSSVPMLTQLCLQKILTSSYSAEFSEDVLPFLPSHLRRDLIRCAAIYSPLSNPILYALYETEGHADSEMIIVGPNAALQDDYFIHAAPYNGRSRDPSTVDTKGSEVEDWESEGLLLEPLHTFILLNSHLAVSSLLRLPPTITHIALINLPTSIPLHRLPGVCPMLVVLDLSYNTWINAASQDVIERVEWSRWNSLRILGLRGCHMSDEVRVKLNKGRWDDVEVIQ